MAAPGYVGPSPNGVGFQPQLDDYLTFIENSVNNFKKLFLKPQKWINMQVDSGNSFFSQLAEVCWWVELERVFMLSLMFST